MKSTALLTVVVGTMLLTTGVAAAAPAQDGQDTVRIVDEEVTIEDAQITVSDATISGPGFPDLVLEDQRFTLDQTVRIDNMEFTIDNTTYEVSDVTVRFENVGVQIQDVGVSDNE